MTDGDEGLPRPWRRIWTGVALLGFLSIALGFVETFRERFCGDWRWETARPLFWIGAAFLLAALGAVALSRSDKVGTTRVQAIYAVAVLVVAAYAVVALSVGEVNLPVVSEDLFGGSDGCALEGSPS